MASSSSYNSPCAACKFLRRKCMPGCIFAPYFPPEEPQKFANVHKIFGASNVTKLLNDLPSHQREDAVNSLAYEAEARVRDPVYGCVGAISFLQRQVHRLQKELDAANADLIRFACTNTNNIDVSSAVVDHQHLAPLPQSHLMVGPRLQGGGFYHHHHHQSFPYASFPWINSNESNNNTSANHNGGCGGGGGGGHSI